MRIDNKTMLHGTLGILDRGSYQYEGNTINLKLSREEMEDVEVYLPEDVEKICQEKDFPHIRIPQPAHCAYGCYRDESFSFARKRTAQFADELKQEGARPVLVLNLANPVHPGGGVHKGSNAQEEDLCRKSSLLLSLESEKAKAYYDYNRSLNTFMGSHAVMIHPQVEIIKDEKGNLLPETAIVAVMTCAAPNLRHGKEGMTQEQYEKLIYDRITGMLKVAAFRGYTRLVLGAFGCGAFLNDARVISDLFYKALRELDFDGLTERELFRSVEFAILSHHGDPYNYNQFCRNFSDFYRFEAENGTAKEEELVPPSQQPVQKMVLFWKDDEEYGQFSNWYRRKFVIDDFEYLFVEQYMMAQKAKLFHDSKRYTAILRANSPRECKNLGKEVTPFDSTTWDAAKYDIVKTANRAKYEQNPDLKALLLNTGDAILAEASPKDRIWGIGMDAASAAEAGPYNWKGQNLLGESLMELREEFAKET